MDGAEVGDEKEWTESFLYLVKKLCVRREMQQKRCGLPQNRRQRLLIKSPVHTARVPLLRALFPKAKFIYIHRHPDEVLLSMAHMLDTTYWYCYLNTPTNEQIQEFIIWQFEHMWHKYNTAAVCPSSSSSADTLSSVRETVGDVLEISYATATSNLRSTMERIYEHTDIPWTPDLDSHFLAEEELLSSYRPNDHQLSLLSPELKKLIRDRWGGYFDAFGYK